MTNPPLPTLSSKTELREQVKAWRHNGETIALVPTMGALHSGHLELMALARATADRTIASIFVNPTQFAPNEDFDRYPRDPDGDRSKLQGAGCDLIWAPTADTMYPEGFATAVVPAGAALGLESDFRPHFFQGVATVCTKLFTQVQPDFAVFGEKDYQQLCVIRQLVRDLDLPLTITPAPIVRASDGLALSSRNRYLSPNEQAIAPQLYAVLQQAASGLANTTQSYSDIERQAREHLTAAGFTKIDYVTIRDAATLSTPPPNRANPQSLRILAAAWLGKTRLIDNISA